MTPGQRPNLELFASINYVGYKTKKIKIPFTREEKNIDLQVVSLEADATNLEGVTVRAEKSSLELKLDKRVFNVGKDLSNKVEQQKKYLKIFHLLTWILKAISV